MILVDTSVWVDHLRTGDEMLRDRLGKAEVLMHPMVLGEIALGSLSGRGEVLRLLAALPRAVVADEVEVRHLTEAVPLHGRGIGYVDTCLLASVRLTPAARLWTRDRRLQLAAQLLDVSV